ncbi:single-stranded DNA-binding protein [Caldicellulosiruptoraceae bacterium PP1]
MNKCIFLGNLVRDPESYDTQNGKKLIRITIAINRIVNGEKKVDFLTCIAFGKTGEAIQKYFNKGKPILVEAKAVNTKRKTASGEEYNTVVFIIESFNFAGGKKLEEHSETAHEQLQSNDDIPEGFEEVSEDELPFDI